MRLFPAASIIRHAGGSYRLYNPEQVEAVRKALVEIKASGRGSRRLDNPNRLVKRGNVVAEIAADDHTNHTEAR